MDRAAAQALWDTAPHGEATPERLEIAAARAVMQLRQAREEEQEKPGNNGPEHAAGAAGPSGGRAAALPPAKLDFSPADAFDSTPPPVPGLMDVLDSGFARQRLFFAPEWRPAWVPNPGPSHRRLASRPDQYLLHSEVNPHARQKMELTTPEYVRWMGPETAVTAVHEPRVLLYFGGKKLRELEEKREAQMKREREAQERLMREQMEAMGVRGGPSGGEGGDGQGGGGSGGGLPPGALPGFPAAFAGFGMPGGPGGFGFGGPGGSNGGGSGMGAEEAMLQAILQQSKREYEAAMAASKAEQGGGASGGSD